MGLRVMTPLGRLALFAMLLGPKFPGPTTQLNQQEHGRDHNLPYLLPRITNIRSILDYHLSRRADFTLPRPRCQLVNMQDTVSDDIPVAKPDGLEELVAPDTVRAGTGLVVLAVGADGRLLTVVSPDPPTPVVPSDVVTGATPHERLFQPAGHEVLPSGRHDFLLLRVEEDDVGVNRSTTTRA